jgi:hypothetical protein
MEGAHNLRALFRVWGFSMSQGKIVPLIAIAQKVAEDKAATELARLIAAIDAEIDELERQLDRKIEQLAQRVAKLEEEEGQTPRLNDHAKT